jgi:phenylacetate-coenzyme A ligase PaaK-like adenylate-forming protein
MMMKKFIATILLTLPMTSMAADSGAGCGLGAMLFDGKSGLAQNVMAATTNGTYGNQTFAMTSGTSGCDTSQPLSVAANDFLDQNMEKVARDMATGQGESVATLANLMGVSQQDQQTFVSLAQENFSTIFNSSDVSSQDVISAVITIMKQDSTLTKYVS